jgi:hypothetical protein
VKLKSGYFSRNLPMKKAFRRSSLLSLVFAAACASAGAPGADPASDTALLSGYSGRAVLVLPLQQVSETPGLSLSRSDAAAAFREEMDYEIRFAFGDSPPARWVFAPAIIESSKRNIGVSADPLKLSVEGLTEKLPEPEDAVSETLRTQIRQLLALTDARYVLLPVNVRVSKTGQNGMQRATMRVVLIDARLARVRWAEDISTEPAPTLNRAVAAALASRLAVMAGLR